MGAYINPKTETKEEFLKREGKLISFYEAKAHADFEKDLVVALIDNFAFSAAGIAFDKAELKYMVDSAEVRDRPFSFYLVPKSKLLEVSNLEIYL